MAENRVRIRSDFDKNAEKGVESLRAKFARLQKDGASGLAIGAGAALTAKGLSLVDSALSGVISGVGDSIQAASSLNEAMFKSSQVFGANADDIEDWAATASDSFGQSKRQAIQAASGFGDLLQISGLATDAATDMSKSLTELASDLASMNDTSVDDALIALKAGLVGETEPMRRFGALLSEARVKAKAYELGIAEVGATLTEGQKVQARYAVIMGDTSRAQGVFGADSNSLADKQRQLTAAFEDASAELGQALLPVANELARTVRDEVVPAIRDLIQAGKDAQPVFDILGGVVDRQGMVWDLYQRKVDEVKRAEMDAAVARSKALIASRDRFASFSESAGIAMSQVRTASLRTITPLVRVKDKLDDLKDAASDAASEIAEAVYGTSGLKGRKAVLNMDLQDAIRHLEKLERIKEPTRAQRKDMHETRGEIADLRTDIVGVTEKLVLLGDKPSKDQLEAWLINKGKRLDEIGAKARAARRRLQGLGVFTEPVDPTGGHGAAAGGPIHGATWVGEGGHPEMVIGSGFVANNLAAMGGGGVTVNFNSTWPPTTQQAREIVDFIDKQLGYRAS